MENLSKDVFSESMEKLQCVFNAKLNEGTPMAYWEYLSTRFTDTEFKKAVEHIILKEKFFPAISVFISHKGLTLAQRAH